MADEFDPLKQTDNKPTEELYVHKTPKTNDDDLLRSPFEDILKLGQKREEKPKEEIYHRLNYTSNAVKAPVRSTNPFDEDVHKSQPTTSVIQQLPQAQQTASEQSYWENTEEFYNQNYEPGPPPAYYPEEYYDEQITHKKRGFAAAVDRLVQRIPVLGIFYKQPPPQPTEVEEYFEEEEVETDEPPRLVPANSTPRDLTADKLALNERYSNKLRTQMIHLQPKDSTQPVDVCVHHESYTVYSCDVGRNVIEIFDLYGKLQHVIDDHTINKFQPTSIAVTCDGTIIVASHFNHRLHMYSPDENENYRYKQYKLGSPGHNIHEFFHPADISIDPNDGYLYISDRGNYRIQVLRPEGICERAIDLLFWDQKETPVSPIQIAHQKTGDQIVCLIDKGGAICFVSKYANGPTYVEPLHILDNDGLGLQGGSGLAIDSHDRIFLSDAGHHRIVICASDGSYITHIGTEGNGPGELKRPCGLDITNDGTIIVADSGNKRLQLFGSIREQIDGEDKSDDKNILLIDPEKPVI